MTEQEIIDIKDTINWLLHNGEFNSEETAYNCAMNSINTLDKAITVTPCCTELKSKEALTFEEWKRDFIVEEKNDRFWHIDDVRLSFDEMKLKYKEYIQVL